MGDAAETLDQQREPTTIAWIDVRLKAWAEWCETGGVVVGLGYGKNPIGGAVDNGGMIIRSTGTAAQPDSYDPNYEIDQAVVKLGADLKTVVVEHYRHEDAPEAKRVYRCGCSRSTYFRRLAKAHQHILFMLPAEKKVRSGAGAMAAAAERRAARKAGRG
ncbi:hypothetical protein [Marinobacterium lutimaris]|uniref:Phage antitermination protein Q n=1 Tax=Marinobacterium lutimaris TaxID=568106 RepID=A0A1H5XV72_9GAMM|nr:hypothetical protein [Marinobacterium lutimaris]SEG15337.1 hypothetical protein SAMN05444390_1011508 [Marinobacterium lutimaris]